MPLSFDNPSELNVMMSSTIAWRFLFRIFEFSRRYTPPRVRRSWGQEDEFAWRRMTWLRRRTARVKNRLGQMMIIRLDSLGDLYAAFGRREERNIPEILNALPPGGIVLDIGAHIGGFSLIAAQAVGPNGQVFAFEPVSKNADLLEQNARLNQIDWLVPVRAAVGRETGSIELLLSDADTMWASTRQAWADVLHHGTTLAHVTAQQVSLVTIDDFLREQAIESVALMKIDVEAAEMDVLAGAAHSLARGCIEQVIVEVHGPTVRWKDVAALLQRYGYEVDSLGGGEMHAVLKSFPNLPTRERAIVSKPITMALIGCGAVSEVLYARALDALAGKGLAETVALVDPNPARTAQIGAVLSTARQYRDLDAMFEEFTPDLAIIAVPHRFHADLSIACLQKGVHVLCEKPMATTTAECDRMIAAADKAGCLLAVGHFRRFFPSCIAIKQILDSGVLGPVQSFRFLEGETYSWPAQSASFFKRSQAGGGVLIDAGAHTIDLLLWWFGDVVDMTYEDDAMGGVEANCRLHLRMASGATGIVQLSRDWPLPNRYIIECEKGWVTYICDVVDRIEWGLYGSGHGLNSQIYPLSENDRANMRTLDEQRIGLMDCFAAQLRNVISAIQDREALRVSGTEARSSVAVIEKCYADRSLLAMPWLDSAEMKRVRELGNAR